MTLPTAGRFRVALILPNQSPSRGDTRQATYNRGPFDIATLAIFPEYIEFDGGKVLRLVVEGAAGRTVA
jgi:hypothetical protein